MKMPGQRSGFHICDILDLNNSNNETKIEENTTTPTSSSSGRLITSVTDTVTTPIVSLTPNSTTPLSRDETNHMNRLGLLGSSGIGSASSYQLPANINSAMLAADTTHYHSMFPSAAKSWFHDSENYGK